MANISVNRHSFPSEEDYSGAMTALRRLQDTYRLKPTYIAQGKLSNKGLPMSSKHYTQHSQNNLLSHHDLILL